MSIKDKADKLTNTLKSEWELIGDFCKDLSDEEWDLPTECPGWTVRDNLSHIIGTEYFLTGKKPPEIDLGDTSHLKNDIAKLNELWVQERRDRPGTEVLSEFEEITKSRIQTLSNLSDEEWEAEGMTPVGPAPYWRFMQIRILDCWMHEQDMRLATSKPGNASGAPLQVCLEEVSLALGFVVGKKAAAPQGCKVNFDLTGPEARSIKIEVEEKRAELVDDFSNNDPADITIQTDTLTFTRLTGGRTTADKIPDDIKVEASSECSETAANIVNNLGYMI